MSDQENPNANASLYSLKDLAAALPPRSTAFSPTDRAEMVNALKDRLQHLVGQPAYLESLSPNVKKRVQVLQDLQHQHDEIEARFHEEKAALELKYQKLYEPFYVKRAEIVNGQELEGKDSEIPKTNGEQEGNEKGVPEFWLTAMKTNEILSEQITEKDEGALKYLKDIKSFILDDPKGFRLNFYFDSNSYFKNTVLSKTYHMVVDDDEPILERAIGTEIDWNPGKNLTQKVFKKKPKKGAKNAKPVTKTEQCDSFFNFFSPPQVPEDDENIVPDEADQLQDVMEQDYDVGSTIKDKIIPHAVSWFTGEALQEEDFEDDPYDDEGEDEEDEDEETDDEDEEEEENDDDDNHHHHHQVLPKRNVAASKMFVEDGCGTHLHNSPLDRAPPSDYNDNL